MAAAAAGAGAGAGGVHADATVVKLRVNHLFIERIMTKLLSHFEGTYLSGINATYKEYGFRHDFSNTGSRDEIFEWVVAAARLFQFAHEMTAALRANPNDEKAKAFNRACRADVKNNDQLRDQTAIVLADLKVDAKLAPPVRTAIRDEVKKAVSAACAIYEEPEYSLLFYITIDEQAAVQRIVHKIVHQSLTKFLRSVILTYKDKIATLAAGHKTGVKSPSKTPSLTSDDIKLLASRTATDDPTED